MHGLVPRAIQTQPKPYNLAKLPNDDPILAWTKGPVGRRRVSVLKNQHQWVEWQVCISKTLATQTQPKLQKNPAKSYKTSQIWQDLNQIWLYLVGFSQIQLKPNNF